MKRLSKKLKAKILDYTEKHQPKFYWDYRDELHSDELTKLLEDPENGRLNLECEIMDANENHEWELRNNAISEITDYFEAEISEKLRRKRQLWEEDFQEWLSDYVTVDLNLDDLLKNNGKEVFFYATGQDFEGWGQSPAEYRLDRRRIKKALGITDSCFDKKIDLMLCQAGYGGSLVVYFNANINDLLDGIKEARSIRFKNAHIAIINTGNGSGDSCHIGAHGFTLPFSQENLFYEKSIKYNYSFAVCGMSSNWCNDTDVFFSKEPLIGEIPKTSLGEIREQDRKYDEIFRSGKCSLGDIDINRHRNTVYINDFPCGTHCKDCGHFWVD